ncbi:tetratricopeptide repeat protein [Aliikangiella maris]|uniref:Sel1 repeat family protein n=2 Tax=Aliikangiella maris TaxID=3162458 RepID=A0ABV2BTC6_9GAMM
MRFLQNLWYIFFLLFTSLLPYSASAEGVREFASQKNVYVTEWSKLKHRAELGDPEALFVLGNFYFDPPKGNGFRRNYKKASEFYFQASLRDYAAAQYNIALMLHQGLGFKKDILESYVWFFLASTNTSPVAKHINTKTGVIVQQLEQQLSSTELVEAKERIKHYQKIIKSKRFRDAKMPEHH